MEWKFYRSFEDIPGKQIYQMLKLRQDVFVLEQECFYEDIDNADEYSEHLFLQESDILVGYARIVPAGKKYEEVSIGRIVIAPDYRGKNLGKELVKKCLQLLEKRGEKFVRIEAQAHLVKFYEQLGFVTDGEEYILDGIPHIEMVMRYLKG